ncbi:MAG: hypothetical protein JW750_05685 [Anaerolineaceae bacterium]|nr:hypothetical protein [Anaerolineaceae bacterium]
MSKTRIHYVVSTHWDREWYSSFQDFRYRLVRLMDKLIKGFEEGRMKGPFTMDGQVVPIEDYLEIRPERRAQVEGLIREGKIVVGPWYAMPDEFTVPGESLVRNLRLGCEMAKGYGAEPSRSGFMCDIFGHNSQIPQIFKGVGVKSAFLWRGTNQIMHRNIIWRGADGTEMPTYRFEKVGYCSFAIHARSLFHNENDYNSTSPTLDLERGFKALDDFIRFQQETSDVDSILLFDGCDHQEWDEPFYAALLERMMREESSFHFVHSTLDDFSTEMIEQLDQVQTVLSGELREPGLELNEVDQQWLIPGVLSSRVWHKQMNWNAESLLCRWAEPISAAANAWLGSEYPQGFLNVAWRWLIQNHPHDSIDGCSIDQVHRDMVYRFDQARQIADRLSIEATKALTASIEGTLNENEFRVAVFNPNPRALSGTQEVELTFDAKWPCFNEFFGFEPKPAFRVYGADGKEIPYQRLGQELPSALYYHPDTRFRKVRVALDLDLPALGYTSLVVRGEANKITRHPNYPGMATSDRSMENEFLAVHIHVNGSMTLVDKSTGRKYERLNTFEDCADIGDGWYHGVAANDQVFSSLGARADIAVVHNGTSMTQFRVRTHFEVPEAFDFTAMKRSETFKELVIESLLTLRFGQKYLEVETRLVNTVKDHRLRALFFSGASEARTYLADSQFDVVEREIALRADNYRFRELEVETKPQQSWTAVYDHSGGLAVISAGQLESAVRDVPARPIALTLFRSSLRTVGTGGQPDGEVLGDHRYHYYIQPLNGAPDRVELSELGQRQSAGLRVVQLDRAAIERAGLKAARPAQDSYLSLHGAVVMSSLRMVDGGLEARLFNPNETESSARIVMGSDASPSPFQTVRKVNLLSEALEDAAAIVNGCVKLDVRPKEIVTLRFE